MEECLVLFLRIQCFGSSYHVLLALLAELYVIAAKLGRSS